MNENPSINTFCIYAPACVREEDFCNLHSLVRYLDADNELCPSYVEMHNGHNNGIKIEILKRKGKSSPRDDICHSYIYFGCGSDSSLEEGDEKLCSNEKQTLPSVCRVSYNSTINNSCGTYDFEDSFFLEYDFSLFEEKIMISEKTISQLNFAQFMNETTVMGGILHEIM